MAEFKLKLEKDVTVKIIAYKELADSCYRKLYKEDIIGVLGLLKSCGEIEVQELFF